MTKIVLDIGNCDPDHNALKRMLVSNYDVELLRAHQLSDAMVLLNAHKVDLILINRKLDIDYSDGTEILKSIKKSEEFRDIPVMIVTNYPEHQLAAIAEGAEYGFGKLEYKEAATHERLAKFLVPKQT